MKPRERIKKIPNTRPGANMIAKVRKDHIGWFGVPAYGARLAFKGRPRLSVKFPASLSSCRLVFRKLVELSV